MVLEILKGTPPWVYCLLIFLIYKGIKATKPKVVRMNKLFLTPAAFFFLMASKMSYNPSYFGLLLIIGIITGCLLYKGIQVRADKKKQLLEQPASYIPLVLILLSFVKGYFVGYTQAVNPVLAASHGFGIIVAATSGFFAGIFLGRTAVYMVKFGKAQHTDLDEPVRGKR